MRSVLITTDYVKKEDGTLTPVEINTNTGYNAKLAQYPLTVENFELNFNGFFDHTGFDTFLKDNSITKVTTIENANRYSNFFKVFCEKYEYEFEENIIGNNGLVPEYEEEPDELVIRIAYDPFAILDDLYTRDMYEFHNLIQSESFASPVTFSSSLDLNTIDNLESPVEQDWPNYLLKSRLPGYSKKDYPKLYNITSQEDLETLQNALTENEFLQKYEIYSGSLSEFDGRQRAFRSTDLIYGNDLETLQLFTYQKVLDVSIDNEKFIYDSPFKEDGIELNLLHSSRFLPIDKLFLTYPYHIDESDFLLNASNTLSSINDLQKEDELTTVVFTDVVESGSIGYPLNETDLQNFTITSSSITRFLETGDDTVEHAFINITIEHPNYGKFDWYDGITTPYYIQKQGTSEFIFFYENIGFAEEGDKILIYNKQINEMVPFLVTNVLFDLKEDKNLFLISLNPGSKFFVEIDNSNYQHGDSPFFLIQHNAGCDPGNCFAADPFACETRTCFDCSKNDEGCPDCGGEATGITCGQL